MGMREQGDAYVMWSHHQTLLVGVTSFFKYKATLLYQIQRCLLTDGNEREREREGDPNKAPHQSDTLTETEDSPKTDCINILYINKVGDGNRGWPDDSLFNG